MALVSANNSKKNRQPFVPVSGGSADTRKAEVHPRSEVTLFQSRLVAQNGNVFAGQMGLMSFAKLSPEALIELCFHGDVAAWEEFMSRYHRLIAGVVFRTAQKWGEASHVTIDDLIQDTYLKLCADDYRLLRAYDPKHPDAIFGYLKVVTANVVHDRFKALRSEKRGGAQILEDLTTLENRSDADKAFGSQNEMERQILLRRLRVC